MSGPAADIARLAQSAERKALNLVVVGSSPTVGVCLRVYVCATSQHRACAMLVHRDHDSKCQWCHMTLCAVDANSRTAT